MDANSSPDAADALQHVRIEFRAECESENAEIRRIGWTAMEQTEIEMASEGVRVSVESVASEKSDGTRGFVDAVLVGVVADSITTLLFRTLTDIILRLQRRRRTHAAAVTSTHNQQTPDIVLRAGAHQLDISLDIPSDALLRQLTLWAPHVMEAGAFTCTVVDKER